MLRSAVWLCLAALGAGAGGCLRDTQHACEAAGACGNGDDGDAAGEDGAGTDDARTDAIVNAIDANSGVIEHVPLAEEMLGTVILDVNNDRTLDTSTLQYNGSTQPWLTLVTTEQGNQVALARLESFTVEQGKNFDVVGAFPLVIIARQVSVAGTIDASANSANDGPGAILAGSAVGEDGVTGTDANDGGGGGGGHGTGGGAGGTAGTGTGGNNGNATGDANITTLVGGGAGGRGAAGGCARANGGGGGGALQIYAMEILTVTGTIDVSGGGGQRNAACSAGGGGGGGGGALYLQSSTAISLGSGSRIASNGGGGGSGGGSLAPGNDGNDGVPGLFAANGGGAVAGGGGAGGAGGVLTTPPVDGGDGARNGGGGGGAVGRIVAHAPMVTAALGSQASPAFVRRP